MDLKQEFEAKEGVHWNPYSKLCADFMQKKIETLQKQVERSERDINLYVEWLCGQTKFARFFIRGKIFANKYDKLMEIFSKEAPKPTILDK